MTDSIGVGDMGATPEIRFDEAAKIGKLVVDTAQRRSDFKVVDRDGKGDAPNIPFLEVDKLTKNYKNLIIRGDTINDETIEDAEMASLALSLEAALQINAAKSVREPGIFIESTDSLEDINLMLSIAKNFVYAKSEEDPVQVGAVAGELIRLAKLDINDNFVSWANETMLKASERITKKIEGVKSVLG